MRRRSRASEFDKLFFLILGVIVGGVGTAMSILLAINWGAVCRF